MELLHETNLIEPCSDFENRKTKPNPWPPHEDPSRRIQVAAISTNENDRGDSEKVAGASETPATCQSLDGQSQPLSGKPTRRSSLTNTSCLCAIGSRQSNSEFTKHFTTIDSREPTVDVHVDVLADELNGAVGHRELSTAYVLTLERIIVRPVALAMNECSVFG